MSRIPRISDRFADAKETTRQQARIAELQAEVERLRASQAPELEAQLAALREQLALQSGEQQIAVDLIDPNPHQPRQTITEESIQIIASSLEKDQQITPIILIPQGDRYLLWDGQRRWEAAKRLGWETIRAVLAPMPEDLHRKALLTFLHHEDLNPLDKVEAIVKEICRLVDITPEQISTVLSRVLRRLERAKQIAELTSLIGANTETQQQQLQAWGMDETEEKLLLVLLDLALNPASVKTNLLPMLSLPQDLKDAIRQRHLKGVHALSLSALSAKTLNVSEQKATQIRISATEEVIAQNLSVAKTRELVASIKAKYLKADSQASKAVSKTLRQLEKFSTSAMSQASPDELAQLRQALHEKIAAIDSILQ